ncbi:hypothetical protein AVEN_74352-1 [Araneus ventricosus]|uniref:C-type lectin domain-containing protein n=1 Tax=Araneus ventricosus TaxID=182803 RepID=A0A4Y2WFB9_ARAVE|nr:hypothetical protein AVEN_74352-1 [Araneus ventricosus]
MCVQLSEKMMLMNFDYLPCSRLKYENFLIHRENGDNNSLGWAKGEPVHDCVALDIASGNLITLPCATELAFVCQNTGFPVYPVSGTLACPNNWLFYYHSPMTREKCIRPFSFHPETSFMDQSEACSNIGGTVADTADYTNSYNYFSRLNITGKYCAGKKLIMKPKQVLNFDNFLERTAI